MASKKRDAVGQHLFFENTVVALMAAKKIMNLIRNQKREDVDFLEIFKKSAERDVKNMIKIHFPLPREMGGEGNK